MKKNRMLFLSFVLILTLSCTCLPSALFGSADQETVQVYEEDENEYSVEEVQQSANEPFFRPIVFCEDVSDEGVPLNSSSSFPAGTGEVWAYFSYENMRDGMTWGRLWEHEGEVFFDARAETWEDGTSGWVAYSVTGDERNVPLSGRYSLSLYIGSALVQRAEFSVTEGLQPDHDGSASIGTIQFAEDITDDYAPIRPSNQFEEGIAEVYAIFSFDNMKNGQSFRREWIWEGELIAEKDLDWEEGEQGIDYAVITQDGSLDAGEYTLNLYLDDQLVRSASFNINGAPKENEPAEPEDLIDGYMMPAWENLAYSDQEVLRDLAQFVLDNHIPIYMDETYDGEAAYRHSCDTPPVPGAVVVSWDYWNNNEWAVVTSTLGHELTHAVQHLSGNYPCGCSIEKEYYAWITGFYVLQEMDRMDILDEKYRGVVYDYETGKFDGDMLWDRLQEVYPECPDY